MPLTLEERERRAYIEGDAALASALGAALDCESDAIDELQHEVESLKYDVQSLEQQLEDALDEVPQ